MGDESVDIIQEANTPNSLEEIRQRRLAYFQNADANLVQKSTNKGVAYSGTKQPATAKKKATEKVPKADTKKAAIAKNAEFQVSIKTEDETSFKRITRSEESATFTKVTHGKTPPGACATTTSGTNSNSSKGRRRRTNSCSSVSDDEVGPLRRTSACASKPFSSSGTPQFTTKSHVPGGERGRWEREGGREGGKVHGGIHNSGDGEVESLFSNRKWVSADEIPDLSVKESADLDSVSVFKSKADFDELGLSTHRPESMSSEVGNRPGTRQRSVSSDSLLVGNMLAANKAQEIRSLLGEQKYRAFVEKSERELGQLHKVVESHHSAHWIGEHKEERVNRKTEKPFNRETSSPPQQSPSPYTGTDGNSSHRETSPRRRLRSSSPHTVSRTLQDIARNKEMREGGMSRNYEQVVIPHNVTFSADEIYRQAYGEDGRHSASTMGSVNFHDHPSSQVVSPYWNSLTPRQMAGMISPNSPHGGPFFQAPFMPLSSGAMVYPPPTPPQASYTQSPQGSYFYPQGGMAGGGGQFVPFSPKQQQMFMTVPPPGTPPHSPDPYLFHHHPGHPLSQSVPCGFHPLPNGPAPPASAGVAWQHGAQSWQDGQVFLSAPHPPSNVDNRRGGQRSDCRSAAEHADAVRHHHEQRRQMQEKQQVQASCRGGNQEFSAYSLERYFASIGMPPPPDLPPPPYSNHQPPVSQPQQSQQPLPQKQQGKSMTQHQEQGRNSSGQHQRLDNTSKKEAAKDDSENDNDNLTTVTHSSMMSGTSLKAGGVTERLQQLGLDPELLQALKHSPERAVADEEALDALRNLVRICPECSAVNKEYMTWCLQCGGVLIGIDPIPAKDLRKKKKGVAERDPVMHSSMGQTADTSQYSSSHSNKSKKPSKSKSARSLKEKNSLKSIPEPDRRNVEEPFLEYAEDKFEEIIYDEDGVPESCEKERALLITSPARDSYSEELAEDGFRPKVESPESGKGGSSSSSPARRNISRDASEDVEEQIQNVLEVVETKDSGRPSSSEDTRKHPLLLSQTVPDDGPRRSSREINDICEVISDPIIRGFIKNYLQKKPGDQVSKAKEKMSQHKARGSAKESTEHDEYFASQPYTLDLGSSVNSTAKLADRSKGAPTPKKKRPVKKGHEAIDVEIFGMEEARLCRSARSGANVVPKLNLVNSSDEDEDSDKGTSMKGTIQYGSSDTSTPSEIYFPVNYDKELEAAARLLAEEEEQKRRKEKEEIKLQQEEEKKEREADGKKTAEKERRHENEKKKQREEEESANVGPHQSSSDSSAQQMSRNQQGAESNFVFLKQLVDNPRPSSSFSAVRRSTGQRLASQSSNRPNVVSKVRESIEASSPNRRWMRSSIAWSSYHPRELRTRSSINVLESSVGKLPQSHVRVSRSSDYLSDSSANSNPLALSSQHSSDKRPRPASADQHGRKVNRGRPSSAGGGRGGNGRPFSAGHLSIPHHSHHVTSESAASGDHVVGSSQRNDSESDNLSAQSPRSTEVDIEGRPIHRLIVQEDTLPLIPAGPAAANKIYDRCTQTPREDNYQLSKWLYLPDELWLHVFTYLPQLDLHSIALTCKQLHNISLDTQLWKSVTVKKKAMTDGWLEEVARRRPVSLAMVQCHGDQVSETALRDLFKEVAPTLKELNFSRCSRGKLVGDEILLHASTHCRHLTHVDASWTNITDVGLAALADCCHSLESLCLNGCQKITDDCLKSVVEKHGTSLRVLELFGCFSLSPASFRFLGEHCTFLLTLNIGQWYKISDSNMVTLSTNLSRVETLDLRGCKKLGDNSIRRIVRNCKRLRDLTLANCHQMTNAAIVEIATYSKDIRSLDVCGCSLINDSSIKTLASNCNRLTSIDISSTGCTHKSVLSLAEHCDNLECAKFNFLPDVHEQSLTRLIKNCKRLNTIHLYGCNVRNQKELKRYNRFLHIEM